MIRTKSSVGRTTGFFLLLLLFLRFAVALGSPLPPVGDSRKTARHLAVIFQRSGPGRVRDIHVRNVMGQTILHTIYEIRVVVVV